MRFLLRALLVCTLTGTASSFFAARRCAHDRHVLPSPARTTRRGAGAEQEDDNLAADRQPVGDGDGNPPAAWAAATSAAALVASWALLTSGSLGEFDADIFGLASRIVSLDTPSDPTDDMLALPQMSPAEQLLDAFFGPPNYKGNQ